MVVGRVLQRKQNDLRWATSFGGLLQKEASSRECRSITTPAGPG